MPHPILPPSILAVPTDMEAATGLLMQVMGPVPIPVGAPGASSVVTMFRNTLPVLGSHFRMPSSQFVDTSTTFEALSTNAGLGLHHPDLGGLSPEWSIALELARDGPLELQMLFVGEVVLASTQRQPLPPVVRRIHEDLHRWRQHNELPISVTTSLADLLTRLVLAFDRGAMAAPEVRRRLVSTRIAHQLLHQVGFDDPAKTRLVRRGHELTPELHRIGLAALKIGMERGDVKSLLVAAAYWLGILIEDLLDLPFDPRPSDTLQLLLPQGLADVDLSLPLNELDHQRLPGTVPAARRLLRHLPMLLTQGLYDLRKAAEGCRFYGDLLGQTQLRRFDPVPLVDPRYGTTVTIAKLIQSRTAFLLDQMKPVASGFATLRFDHFAKSVHPYLTFGDDELWNAECTRAVCVGWGPLVPRSSRLAVGSSTTAMDAQIIGALNCLERDMAALRPGRKADPDQVIKFHNAYAMYIAFAISIFLGLRRFAVFPLLASMLGQTKVTSIRHKVSSRKQVPPLIIFPFVQVLLRLWIKHCKSLEVRIDTLLRRYPAHPRLVAAKAHVRRVLKSDPVALLFKIGDAHVEALGTKSVQEALSHEWKLSEDAGRNWLVSALRAQGLTDTESQYLIQHIVPGAELMSSDSTRSPIELRSRAAAAHQRAVMQLRISASKGFSS